MAIARVTTVSKSRKEFRCEKCGTTIPKGSTYRHFQVGFRSRFVHRRCMDVACTPRRSELDASKMAAIWDAQDELESAIESADDVDGLKEALESYAEVLREVGEEYREASEGESGQVFNTTAEERADMLEQAADDVENIDVDDADKAECPDCNGTGDDEGDPITCDVCDGTGRDENDDDCVACEGNGEVNEEIDCETCEGEGEILDMESARDRAREALDVDLP